MSHQFTDNDGKDWTLKVNALTLARVEDALGVSFRAEPEDQDGPIVRIATDYLFAFQVIWVLVEPQAIDRGITDEQLGEALVGDTFGKAQAALCDAVAAFPPDPRKRDTIARVFQMIRDAESKLIARGAEQLEALDLDDLIDKAVINAG